jgi:hypothetical protein
VRTAHAASIDTRQLASRLRLRCDGDHKIALLRVSSTSLCALRCSRPERASHIDPPASSYAIMRRCSWLLMAWKHKCIMTVNLRMNGASCLSRGVWETQLGPIGFPGIQPNSGHRDY